MDQTEGRKEGSPAKKLSHKKIQGQRKESHQVPLKITPDLILSPLASLPMQRSQRQHVDFRPPQTWISVTAHGEKPHTSFDELTDTPIDFSTFVMNQVNIANLTQELLAGPAFNLLKGTYKSIMKLEYHFEEYHRGRQVIPRDYFINKDLEYLKGESLSRYSTSVTKTKAATYEIKWIKDMVPNLWSPVKVVYDKHAYWVTRLKIMKRYDYSYLDEIEVRREDQQLYTFKEGDFPQLCLQDIEDMLLLLVQQKLTNLIIDERFDLNVALCEEIVSVFESGPIVSAFLVVYAYCRSCGQFPMEKEGAVDGRGITRLFGLMVRKLSSLERIDRQAALHVVTIEEIRIEISESSPLRPYISSLSLAKKNQRSQVPWASSEVLACKEDLREESKVFSSAKLSML
ncbi:hypothetical protein Tco_1022920 [Tanacetum coccineum]